MNKFYMGIECTCPLCGKTVNIYVKTVNYKAWCFGAQAQTAFPYLSASAREMLISGICPECYQEMFGDSEEEEG